MGDATVTGIGTQWNNRHTLSVGRFGGGILSIRAGGNVTGRDSVVGYSFFSKGEATVTGTNSRWINSGDLIVGDFGSGTLNIWAGGVVASTQGVLGYHSDSTGAVTVIGSDSQWNNSGDLYVGRDGSGTLTISNSGLLSVGGILTTNRDFSGDDGVVNLSTGGMLALKSGPTGDDSLSNFLALVKGTKAIRYWDDALADWADITTAIYGDDYTLEYLTSGDLAGYTLLTVGQLPALPGDYNADGVGDAADYTVWRDNLGQSVMLPNQATPGSVTQYDHDVWAANYGANLTADAIPEPNALALAAFTLGLCAVRRVAVVAA